MKIMKAPVDAALTTMIPPACHAGVMIRCLEIQRFTVLRRPSECQSLITKAREISVKLTPRSVRRGIAATAIASAAVLLPTVALAASGGTASTAKAATAHRCFASNLTVWLGTPGDGAAGSTFYDLELSNTSGGTCTLFGFPGVSADNGGKQLGSAADRDHSRPSTLVTLRPGGTSHVILQITDVGNYPKAACKPVRAQLLRVYAPGAFSSINMPFQGSFGACSRRGPVYLHVTAVLPGTGIPGSGQ
jgi:hypothetical protein